MSNDFQREVAKLLLDNLGVYGFALSGGLALSEHKLSDRPTEDIDLFSSSFDNTQFDKATNEALLALERAGYQTFLSMKADTFARIDVSQGTDNLTVDLGYDFRDYDAVTLDVGSVLDKRDAVLNKVSALYARMLPRDFIDVYNSIQSGYMTKTEILRLSKERDDGFVLEYFADALKRVKALAFEDFDRYGITREVHETIRTAMLSWADEIEASRDMDNESMV